MKRTVNGFTGLRFIWAITIIICHIYLVYQAECQSMGIGFDFLTHGAWGVCSFLVLSGFLVCMHHENKYDDNSSKLLSEGFEFAIKHAKKWYALYMICMIPPLAFLVLNLFIHFDIKGFLDLIVQVIMNVFLIQAWIPGREYSINGVSWYLSCITALYITVPFLLKINNKIKNNKKICAVGIFICFIAVFLCGDILKILYNHPIYRIFQFVIGMLLYDIIKDIKEIKYEKASLAIAVLINIVAYFVLFPKVTALLDTISVMVIVGVLYFIKDDNLFTKRWMLEGGKKSLELFLMHYPIVTLGGAILKRIFPQTPVFYVIEMLLLFIAVFVVVELYGRIIKRIKGGRYE